MLVPIRFIQFPLCKSKLSTLQVHSHLLTIVGHHWAGSQIKYLVTSNKSCSKKQILFTLFCFFCFLSIVLLHGLIKNDIRINALFLICIVLLHQIMYYTQFNLQNLFSLTQTCVFFKLLETKTYSNYYLTEYKSCQWRKITKRKKGSIASRIILHNLESKLSIKY